MPLQQHKNLAEKNLNFKGKFASFLRAKNSILNSDKRPIRLLLEFEIGFLFTKD